MIHVKNKAWDWKKVEDSRWLEPSEDMYYYVHRWHKPNQQNSLLDLGCGLGRHSILFAKEGFNVTAFDLSEEAINRLDNYCTQNNMNINTVCGDMIVLPFEKDTFDYVISYHVISHTNTEGVFSIFKQLKSILKPGGEMFLTLGSQKSTKFKTHIGEWVDSNTLIKDQNDHEHGIPHFYANDALLQKLLKPFEVISIKLSNNVDLNTVNQYGWHYFIHLKQG